MAFVEVERCENDEPVPRWFVKSQCWLRLLAILCTAASIELMLNSDTSVLLSGVMRINARYYYSTAFKFLLGVDVAVCAISTMSLPVLGYTLLPVYKKLQFSRKHWYYLFLHDLIVMTVLISACGAASSIGYVGVYGQPEMFWSKICNNVGKFCAYLGISVAFSYVAFLCFFALAVISSYVLMKPSVKQEQERPELELCSCA